MKMNTIEILYMEVNIERILKVQIERLIHTIIV